MFSTLRCSTATPASRSLLTHLIATFASYLRDEIIFHRKQKTKSVNEKIFCIVNFCFNNFYFVQ